MAGRLCSTVTQRAASERDVGETASGAPAVLTRAQRLARNARGSSAPSLQGWVEQVGNQQYRVTERARSAARQIVRSGYEALGELEVFPVTEGERLATLLNRLVEATYQAPEPPEKWALLHRFRVATVESPLLAQVREHMMDLFAYRDDAHYSAWKPYSVPGQAWNAFTSLCRTAAPEREGFHHIVATLALR